MGGNNISKIKSSFLTVHDRKLLSKIQYLEGLTHIGIKRSSRKKLLHKINEEYNDIKQKYNAKREKHSDN